MLNIDLNCDLGEGFGNDEKLMQFISSANIACGYHAGSDDVIQETIKLCLKYNVAVGAHPGYKDKYHFGRTAQQLSVQQYYDLITDQLVAFKKNSDIFGITIHHIKPHGALYNKAASDKIVAATVAKAVRDFDDRLIMYGLSGSYLLTEAKALGLKTASEVFADRTYQDNGSLTPRTSANALITDVQASKVQVIEMIKFQQVTSINKLHVRLQADTICIHGDGEHAVETTREICHFLKQNNIEIKAV